MTSCEPVNAFVQSHVLVSLGCCLTAIDVWIVCVTSGRVPCKRMWTIPDERASPPFATIPGSTFVRASRLSFYCPPSSLRPSRSHVEKTSAGGKKLDGTIKAEVTLIHGFDAPLEEDQKSEIEDRRLRIEDWKLKSEDRRTTCRKNKRWGKKVGNSHQS